jgi:predicted nucleotidyltransferase
MTPDDDAALAEIAERFGLALIVQFGSTVTGRTHARSDLDIAVRSLPGRSAPRLAERAELEHALAELFPGRRIDLALLDHADPLFLKQVVLGPHRLLHGATRALHELRMLAYRRYEDHRRFLALERRYVEGVITGATRP